MQMFRMFGQNIPSIVLRRSTSLLSKEGQGIAFVRQPQFSLGIRGGARVEVDAPLDEVAVEVGDQAADVAGLESSTGRLPAPDDEALHGFGRGVNQGVVDGIDRPCFWEGHLGVGEEKLAHGRIQREAVDAAAGGVHEHGGRAVMDVSSHHLVGAWLKKVLVLERLPEWGDAPVYAEDGSDGNVDVDVGTAVEGVNHDHVLALPAFIAAQDVVLLLLAANARNGFARRQDAHERSVGKNIELLLVFVVGVLGARSTEDAGEAGAVDLVVDDFRCDTDVGQQPGELSGYEGELRLRIHDEFLEGNRFRHGWILFISKPTPR